MFNGVLLLKPTASQEKVQITTTFSVDVEYNMYLKSHPLHLAQNTAAYAEGR